MTGRIIMAAAAFVMACAPALAAPRAMPDRLPLRHGIFVTQGVPCDQRSNADVQSFWGDMLNTAHETGKILSVVRRGNTYDVKFLYEDTNGESHIVARGRIKILSPTVYKQSGAYGESTMRWCAKKM